MARCRLGVPQLCGNENVFACDPSSRESNLQRLAYLALVPVSLRAIEVSKSSSIRLWVALIVAAASGIRVPIPSTGIWVAPWLSDILVIRKSEDPIMMARRHYLASIITVRIGKS
jgi:uncharacterized membrane protein